MLAEAAARTNAARHPEGAQTAGQCQRGGKRFDARIASGHASENHKFSRMLPKKEARRPFEKAASHSLGGKTPDRQI
jgi:hypothetical protein